MGLSLLQMSHSNACNHSLVRTISFAINSEESTATLFWPVLKYIYKGRFDKKKFPMKPKAEKISKVTSAAFSGWLIVRDIVLQLFGQGKDPEFLMLFYLLEEVSAFNFCS